MNATEPAKNPKHAAGRAKAPFRHIPPVALVHEGAVMAGGAAKYGAFNWGDAGVVASVYYEAMLRHLFAWYSGEDVDPESGCPHLAHIRACCGILLDCEGKGILDDDRPTGKTTALSFTPPSVDVSRLPQVRNVDTGVCAGKLFERQVNGRDYVAVQMPDGNLEIWLKSNTVAFDD